MTNEKKNTIWNILAAGINALESVIIIAVVSRIHSIEIVGVFTIGFSLANLFLMLGKFGVRNYQVAHEGYSTSRTVFLVQRYITAAGMLVLSVAYLSINLILGNYDFNKCSIIMGIIMLYLIEAIEDNFAGSIQVKGELHIGCKVFILRWLAVFICYIALDLLTLNPVLAVWVSVLLSLVVEIICLKFFNNKLDKLDYSQITPSLINLFKISLPLFAANFLYFFMTNISKYAIDSLLGDEVQAIYGYISMPVFVISLLNNMIYVPQLTHYVREYREGNLYALRKRFLRQLAFICLVLICCVIGAYFLGAQILQIIYSIDLEKYKLQIILLLGGGFFLAVGGYISTLMVLFDRRIINMWLHVLSVVLGIVITFICTKKIGINGAVAGYIITMVVFAIGFSIALLRVFHEMKTVSANKY